MIKKSFKKGFTLIETLVAVGVFAVISTAAYGAYVNLFKLISQNQYKILAINLANEQFEIARNLRYADIGTTSGIPRGALPPTQVLNRSGVDFTVNTTVRNVDLPFDGLLGQEPNDLSPADNKFVEIEVTCLTCSNFNSLTMSTTVAPKNLETSSTNGALFVKVFDANGNPLANANVHIENNSINPPIIIDDVTNNEGVLQIIDAPPAVESYEVTVTKAGYTTEKTYRNGEVGNPNPTKPHATVAVQLVTSISFYIDKVSDVTVHSKDITCNIIPDFDFNLTGAKLIGENLPKYNKNLVTDDLGIYNNKNIEWDVYSITGIDAVYDIVGYNPINPVTINTNSVQNIDLILATKNPRTLLINVKDSSTSLPITDATVTLSEGAFISTKITDRGFINQTDWSQGIGVDYTDQDGNIDTTTTAGEIKLKNAFGVYNSSGIIESKTFDTGSLSNFHNFIWSPEDQPVLAGAQSIKFQIATTASSSAENPVWNYTGPDGTSATYYTVSNTSIPNIHDNKRYLRFKLFLQTEDTSVTPNISDISFTMTSSCTPPGQVVFTGLPANTYNLIVSKSGYSNYTGTVNVNSNWKEQEIILSP